MESFRLEEWEIRPAEGSASREGHQLRLEPKLMTLLVCLAEQAGHVVPKQQIFDQVWHGAHVQDVVLSRGISELRRLLGDDARSPRLIETIPRRGYKLIGQLEKSLNEDCPSAPATSLSPPPASGSMTQPSAELAQESNVSKLNMGNGTAFLMLAAAISIVLGLLAFWWLNRAPEPGSLAVLPFANLSGDSELDFFCAGLTEDVIARLSELRGLKVVSRTTAMAYRETSLELPEIAERLRVASVLEGSVRRDGDEVRIVVQLIDGSEDRHRWAATYDRQIRGRFDLQFDIANTIAAQLQQTLTARASSLLSQAPTSDLSAYDLYLRARRHYLLYQAEENETAIRLFTQAVESAPDFALAHAGLASARALRAANYGGARREAQQALRDAELALSLSPELPEAHKARGLALSQLDQPRQALEAYAQALAIRPGYGEALENIAFLRYQLNDWDEVGHWRPLTSNPRKLR